MHGERNRRRQVQLIDLAPHITGDKVDGGLHFRNVPLGLVDTLQAALAKAFLLGHGANRVDAPLKVGGNEAAVSTHAALEIDKMIVVAHASDVLLDPFALPCEPFALKLGRVEGLLGLLQTHGALWGAASSALFGCVTGACRLALQPFELFRSVADGFERRPLFGGHGT